MLTFSIFLGIVAVNIQAATVIVYRAFLIFFRSSRFFSTMLRLNGTLALAKFYLITSN